MREMLRAVQHKTPMDAQRVADLQFDLELAILQKNAAAAAPAAAPLPGRSRVAAAGAAEPAASAHRWRISFRPYPQLFVHGNDPLRMLRELAELGDLAVNVDASNVPALVDAGSGRPAILSWDLRLETDATREVIDQVFDWAEGDCELKIHG